jgi:hypothetical protein
MCQNAATLVLFPLSGCAGTCRCGLGYLPVPLTAEPPVGSHSVVPNADKLVSYSLLLTI